MSFDRLAPHYTWMEKVLAGGRLQRARLAWLETLADCGRILIAGVGHGHFLRRCAERFPTAQITSVDASAGMLRRARRQVPAAGQRPAPLRFVHAALPEWRPPPGEFDAVVTHFFLDCFPPEELGAVIAALAAAARPSARWLIADFTVPSRGLARCRARAIHAVMYRFFRPVARIRARCVTAPDAWLTQHGFRLTQRTTFEWGLLQSDSWQRSGGAVL